jgi:tRNA-2-methylthio-N6-dimethylallyladenosine synthase
MKKYFIKTFGCQMNVSDSDKIAAILSAKKHKKFDNEKTADIIVINMCSVRQSAVDRAYAIINRNSDKKIILCGCVLNRDKLKLKDKVSEFWPPGKYFNSLPRHQNKISAFIPIMTGCNNFCAYCVVPHTRGREISRPVKDILKEIEKLAKSGCKEITLLGQNVNSYSYEKTGFPDLLNKLAKKFPATYFKFLTSHPKDFSDELIKVIAQNKNISREIHLPVQAGSDRILKAMNRPYTQKLYLDLIKKIKKFIPGAGFTTDIIVGFPGEAQKDFAESVKVFKEVGYNEAYINKYSPRPGTAAWNLKETVSFPEKKRREKTLRALVK